MLKIMKKVNYLTKYRNLLIRPAEWLIGVAGG